MKRVLFCVLFSLFFTACGRTEQRQEELGAPTMEAGKEGEGEWICVATPGPGNVATPGQGGILAEGSGHKLENLKKVGEDSPYYSNLQENLGIGFSMNPVLVCPDPVYGITYLVNCGRDYFIYAKRDETAEVAVELPAKALFCRNGELYFIVDDYGKFELSGVKKGDIVKYRPATGDVEILVSDEAYNMRVYPDCILYEQMVLADSELGWWKFIQKSYTFATGEIAELGSSADQFCSTIYRWENLTLWRDSVFDEEKDQYFMDYVFVDEDGAERMRWGMQSGIPMNLQLTQGRLDGDILYLLCKKERKLYACNMRTGEMEPAVEVRLPLDEVNPNADYIFYKDRFIFGDGLSVKKGETAGTVLYRLNRFGVTQEYEWSFLFTDGTEFYGLSKNKLYRLEFVLWDWETQKVSDGFVWGLGSPNEFEADTDDYYLVLRDPF